MCLLANRRMRTAPPVCTAAQMRLNEFVPYSSNPATRADALAVATLAPAGAMLRHGSIEAAVNAPIAAFAPQHRVRFLAREMRGVNSALLNQRLAEDCSRAAAQMNVLQHELQLQLAQVAFVCFCFCSHELQPQLTVQTLWGAAEGKPLLRTLKKVLC